MSKTFVGVLFRNNARLVAPFFYFLDESFKESNAYTVIAIDNGSTDNTVAELAHCSEYGERIFYGFRNNVGIARGRNKIIGLAKANNGDKYPNIVFLDSDVFVTRHGAIKTLIDAMKSKGAGIMCGETTAFRPSDGRYYTNFGISFCAIAADTFKAVGGFDEQFKLYYDDSDFFTRAANARKTKMNCVDAKAVHNWGQTLTAGSEGKNRAAAIKADEARYKAKHG
jgi:GT2 family glycosyltransferase